ncbi:MAG TPA: polysaccharide deacetylase family protein [Puia sp.]|nr:polysaccharide deacetylase family protein [Puia sp.]
MFYFVKTPWLLKKLYPGCVWNFPRGEKKIYLSFDDGPHPEATPLILDQLKKFNAVATFFCIGKNVREQPLLYKRILDEGHRVGNHSHNHLNGWKTKNETYIDNIREAMKYIDSDLYRPPYGRITRFQASILQKSFRLKIIMWDVLSADFDKTISGEKCARNVTSNAGPGSIVIFHDSAKAYDRMSIALPKVLTHFQEKNYSFELIR